MIANAFSLLIMKTYTAVFYVNLAVLFAILVNNYVFVLSILFIVEIAKVGLYSLLKDLFISRFIILNHLDISYFFSTCRPLALTAAIHCCSLYPCTLYIWL